MPISPKELFTSGGATYVGVVRWGEKVPCQRAGVYCVATTDAPDAVTVSAPNYIPSASAYAQLLARRPYLTVDGQPATESILANRLGRFWIPNEPVMYIGLASGSIQARINQYYTTKLGERSPHSGGWWLKTMDGIDKLFVHFAVSSHVENSERMMLERFASTVLPEHRANLYDLERVAPFANVAVKKGTNKRHGLAYYKSDPNAGTPSASHPQQNLPACPDARATLASPIDSIGTNLPPEFGIVLYSQPVTDKDRARSSLRIPSASKFAFPDSPAAVSVVVDGERRSARWRPNGSRSGTLGLGVDVMGSLHERDEPIRIGVNAGTFYLFRR